MNQRKKPKLGTVLHWSKRRCLLRAELDNISRAIGNQKWTKVSWIRGIGTLKFILFKNSGHDISL